MRKAAVPMLAVLALAVPGLAGAHGKAHKAVWELVAAPKPRRYSTASSRSDSPTSGVSRDPVASIR